MRQPTRPLQVYLDSSDISVLSTADERSDDAAAIVTKLQRWKQAGHIEIRFSYAHVAEAAPTKPEHIRSATNRLEFMHQFCWPHALASPSDVLEAEARSLLTQSALTDTFCRDNGDWLPSDMGDLSLTRIENILLRAIVESAPTREHRRAAKRRCFHADGTLTKEGRSQFARMAPQFVQAVGQQFPLTPRSADAIKSYCEGKISGAAAMAAVMDSVRDLRVFSSWLESRWVDVSPTTAWLRESGEKLRQSMATVSDQTTILWTQQLRAGMSPTQIQAVGTNALKGSRREFVIRQAAKLLEKSPDPLLAALLPSRSLDFAPGMDMLAGVMFEIAWLACVRHTDRRPAKVSDAGDLLHCIYLPYVDIFRADGFISDAIKKAAPALASRVVSKLRVLPEEIEQRLT